MLVILFNFEDDDVYHDNGGGVDRRWSSILDLGSP